LTGAEIRTIMLPIFIPSKESLCASDGNILKTSLRIWAFVLHYCTQSTASLILLVITRPIIADGLRLRNRGAIRGAIA